MENNIISQEAIETFLNGFDPEMYIVGVEYDYPTNSISKIIQDPEKGKVVKTDTFVPFLWVGDLSKLNFYNGNKSLQSKMMGKHGILIEKLNTHNNQRLENGMKHLVKSIKSYTDLISFFKAGGIDPWGETTKKYFTILSPVEQYLVQTKKRLFKGIDDYSDVHRFVFDIETTGLNPETDKIILIGIKDNRGLQKTISAFGDDGEKTCIETFFKYIAELKPTIIAGYNSAFFDFPFILKRAKILNVDINKLTQVLTSTGIKEKKSILKLANEVEDFTQHVMWGFNIIDIAHSVRRAQAINSEIKSWGLKYITTYLEKEKPNRIYVEGNKISNIYLSNESYYVNPKTGKYKKIGEPGTENLLERFPKSYEIWSGRKIVEQYLDDDLYETMIVDDSFSQSTFLLSKLIPTTYERIATMGTATLWKIIMLAWSYENNLAIPSKAEKRPFTGGLSRLLNVGFAKNIVKFDFSSLYPSIQLVYDIFPECDVMGVQKSMLKYFRNIRIQYKHLAGELKESNPVLSEMYDRKQLPIKIFINAYFGSLSAPHVFPWGDMDKGEMTTCIGRQCLRMMIMFYQKKGYTPLVMDSVEYDTPIYLKDSDDNIVILPICDLFDENSRLKSEDSLRDFSEKDYMVLTRNGWKNINYVYKHGTNKPIHKLVTKDRMVCCTSDHSVFQNNEKVKPSDLKRGDHVDIMDIPILKSENNMTLDKAKLIGYFIGNGSCKYKKRKRNYFSKTKQETKTYFTFSGDFQLNNCRIEVLEEFKRTIKNEYDIDVTIHETIDGSGVYRLQSTNTQLCKWFFENCFTSYREKTIPIEILNSNNEIIKSFMDGFYLANDNDNFIEQPTKFTEKSKVCISGIVYLLNRLNIEYNINYLNESNVTSNDSSSNIIWNNTILKNKYKYVYDISTEDGSFIGGIGGMVLSNTDGVNFETPSNINDTVYIGKGNNELVIKGKEYHGIEADTAEFNDIFMRNEMGLDIDYVAPSCINVSRKNYIIKILKKGKEKIKLTGNTIKSKKLQQYVVEFLDVGLKYLLNGDGNSFIELYYEYVEKIYNKEIPLSKIANKSRVKQSIDDYKRYIKKTTKAGSLMARQAHMELILLNNYPAGLGDTIYYINNGTKKSQGDVQRCLEEVIKYTKEEKKEIKKNGGVIEKHSVININCYMISEKDIIENPDMKGDYNVERYLHNFNKRVEPLLCVFKPEIREDILIENPKDRQYFTKLQTELVNGHPMKEGGQDKFNEVMTLSDSEAIFWKNMNVDPYFMYVEDSIKQVDQEWVEHNRNVIKMNLETTKNNEDEFFEMNENNYDLYKIEN